MAGLKIGSITFIVNGYYVNNGLPYFQRAVPKDLRKRLGRSKISIPLKLEHGHLAVQCQRLSQKWKSIFKALRNDPALTTVDIKSAAKELLDSYGLAPGDGNYEFPAPKDPNPINEAEARFLFNLKPGQSWRDLQAAKSTDQYFNATPQLDDFQAAVKNSFYKGDPVVVAAVEMLKNPMPVMLSEAFSIYLDNHKRGKNSSFQADQRQHWDKLVHMVGDIPITQLNRDHAKQYRDHRLASGVKAATIAREFNTLAAVLRKVFNELSSVQANPFVGMSIPETPEIVSHPRLPYSREDVRKLLAEAIAIDDERRRIIIMLAMTGARLAEIVGLRRSDVDIANACIHIAPHSSRSLKNEGSERLVPLLPNALSAISRQTASHEDFFVFPSYSSENKVKSDSASAALNKWAKKYVPDIDRTIHSFRHTMRDQLRAVECPNEISMSIGGWSMGKKDASMGYGIGYGIDIKRKWLAEAYKWLNTEK